MRRKNGKRTREQENWILGEVSQARRNGLSVMIDGICCESREEAGRMLFIREEESYMKDYVGDESGRIIGIAFDKVRNCDA